MRTLKNKVAKNKTKKAVCEAKLDSKEGEKIFVDLLDRDKRELKI